MNKCAYQRIFSFFMGAMLLVTCAFPASAAESKGKLKPKGATTSNTTSDKRTATTATTSGGQINVSSLKTIAKEYNVPDEFLEAVSKKKTITLREMQQYASEYNLPAQYVQRFFNNYFVFPTGSGLEYLAVDSSQPKNNYNFNNIVTYSTGEKKYVVDGKSKALKGIDVSEFQGDINWKQVKADGVKFAFIRVGYRGYGTGVIKIDSKFHDNMQGAQAAGVPVGVYFFSQAINQKEALEEARFTLDAVDGYDLQYPVAIDMEPGGSGGRTNNLSMQQHTTVAATFCQAVKKAGYRPMVYSNSQWFTKKLDLDQLPYDKWLALYFQQPFFPYKMNIWQYSGEGRVKGIQGNVDMNLCFVSYQ